MKRTAILLTSAVLLSALVQAQERPQPAPPTAPAVSGQPAIPGEWQVAPVGRDGGLQYDPRGRQGFGVRIVASVAGGFTAHVRQESSLPNEPYVRTVNRRHELECITECFAVRAAAPEQRAGLQVERRGAGTTLTGWASPRGACDPAFADIAVGWDEAIVHSFPAQPGSKYTVIFGLCESHHTVAGQRPLELRLEGTKRKAVDPIADNGRHVPVAYALEAADENGDGRIDVAVAPVAGAPDTNAILNILWVFPAGQAPPLEAVIAGRHNGAALAYVACGSGQAPPPRDDVLILRLRAPQGLDVTTVPTLTIDAGAGLQFGPDRRGVRIGARTAVACQVPFTAPDGVSEAPGPVTLRFPAVRVPAGGEHVLLFGVHRGPGAAQAPASLAEAEQLRAAYARGERQ
ncbi:MAG: hypothetical protein AB1716_10045 [Planctomycetota bacterium]